MNVIDKMKMFWASNRQAYIRLIIINVAFSIAVWLTAIVVGTSQFAQVPDSFGELIAQPYTLITYMFAHAGLWHLVGNMFILYFVGSIFEDLLGRQKTIYAYLVAGIVGALVYVAVVFNNSSLVGASGAVMGLLYGLTVLRPNYEFFLYGLIKLKLWWITVAFAVYDLLMVLVSSGQAGGQVCHLAGGLTGVVLVSVWTGKINTQLFPNNKPNDIIEPYKITVNRSPKRASKAKADPAVPTQEDIDRILDKINESGYEKLTKEEKETLFRAKDLEV